jgi:hypothetical protein
MKHALINFGIVLIIFYGCVETEPVSRIPEITFKNFELFQGYDSLQNLKLFGELIFSFIDGDADIGLDNYIVSDTSLPDSMRYNVFLIPFQKIDSTYLPIEIDTSNNKPPPFYAITRNIKMERVGQNKTIKGTITIDIEFDIIPPYDTIRYDFFIKDRAGHRSNVESTSDIGLKGVLLPNSL